MISILLVGDSARDAMLYRRALASQDKVRFLHVESGEAALELLQRDQMDLFLLNVSLPGMSGYDLAHRLREPSAYELTPIIFITGDGQDGVNPYEEFHCYSFITKPISMDTFSAKVRQLIGKLQRQEKASDQNRRSLSAFETPTGTRLISIDEILFAGINCNHSILHLQRGLIKLSKTTLQDVIRGVGDPNFLRCHKSFAVNIKQIAAIERVNYRLSLIGFRDSDKTVDLSRSCDDEVRAQLNRWMVKSREGALNDTVSDRF